MEQTIGEYFQEVNSIPSTTPADRVMAELLKRNPDLAYDEARDMIEDLAPGKTYTVAETVAIVARVLRPESEE